MPAMTLTFSDLIPVLPEIFVLAMACAILLLDVTVKQRMGSYTLTLLTLVGAAAITAFTSVGQTQYAFGGQFVDDMMADVLKLMVYLTSITVVVYSRAYLIERDLFKGEFFVLLLFATLGMMVMISANHFLVLYIGLELLSLSLYALVAMRRVGRPGLRAFALRHVDPLRPYRYAGIEQARRQRLHGRAQPHAA